MDPRLAALQNSIGATMRRRREAAGLSQEAVAERAGIQPRHVQRLEAGESNLRVWTLLRLADALGVPADALLAEILAGVEPT